jgi:hypothetical protein
MKLAWLVRHLEDGALGYTWEIVFEEPRRGYSDVKAIVYQEVSEGEPA